MPAKSRPSEPPRRLAICSQRKVLGLTLGMGSYNYVFYLLLYWLPSYLSLALHIDLSALVPVHQRAVAHRDLHRRCRRRLAGGFSDPARLECEQGAPHGPDRRHGVRAGHSGRGARPRRPRRRSSGSASRLADFPRHRRSPGRCRRSSPARNDVGKVGGILNFSGQISGIAAPIITGYVVSSAHSYAWAFGVAADLSGHWHCRLCHFCWARSSCRQRPRTEPQSA